MAPQQTKTATRLGDMRPVLKLIFRRLVLAILILWLVSVLVFAATEALPGNAAVAKLARNATPAAVAGFRAQYHLNEPIVTQYIDWLGHILTGRLGISLASGTPVSSLIGQRIVNTLVLLCMASLFGIPLALGIGISAAMRRDRVFDHSSALLLLALAALPEFVIGITLTVLLATNVAHLLPAASLVNPAESILSQLRLVLLPAITLALAITPYIARMIRASMIEVLDSEYVAMARLKGLSERRVILYHALINAAGPTLQVLALTLAYLVGGVVVVETVFQYPGIGLALVQAVQARDLPVIQALVLFIAAFYAIVNITADLVTTLVSPRFRTELK